MDQHLTWTPHIEKVLNKMTGSLAVLRSSRNLLSEGPLKTVTQTLVLSHMDYCSCLLSTGLQTSLNKLQTLQNRAARLVLTAHYKDNTSDMHRRLQWPTVKERLYTGTLSMFNKLLATKKPEAIYKRLQNVNSTHDHNTRFAKGGSFRLPKPKTATLTRTFLYRCSKSHNSFPPHIKSTTPSNFKTQITKWIHSKIDTTRPLQYWW